MWNQVQIGEKYFVVETNLAKYLFDELSFKFQKFQATAVEVEGSSATGGISLRCRPGSLLAYSSMPLTRKVRLVYVSHIFPKKNDVSDSKCWTARKKTPKLNTVSCEHWLADFPIWWLHSLRSVRHRGLRFGAFQCGGGPRSKSRFHADLGRCELGFAEDPQCARCYGAPRAGGIGPWSQLCCCRRSYHVNSCHIHPEVRIRSFHWFQSLFLHFHLKTLKITSGTLHLISSHLNSSHLIWAHLISFHPFSDLSTAQPFSSHETSLNSSLVFCTSEGLRHRCICTEKSLQNT